MANILANAQLISATPHTQKLALRKGEARRYGLSFRAGGNPIDITNYDLKAAVDTEVYNGTVTFTPNDFTFRLQSEGDANSIGTVPVFGKVSGMEAQGRATVEIDSDFWLGANPPANPAGRDEVPIVVSYLRFADAPTNGQVFLIPLVIAILRGIER